MVLELAANEPTTVLMRVSNDNAIGRVGVIEARVEHLNFEKVEHQHRTILQRRVGASRIQQKPGAVEAARWKSGWIKSGN
jgi:hypothetical protein